MRIQKREIKTFSSVRSKPRLLFTNSVTVHGFPTPENTRSGLAIFTPNGKGNIYCMGLANNSMFVILLPQIPTFLLLQPQKIRNLGQQFGATNQKGHRQDQAYLQLSIPYFLSSSTAGNVSNFRSSQSLPCGWEL